MNNQVDKLFKEKLEEHSLQPSAQAWEKVEAHLGKKNKMALWLRVAAAVAMLGALTFVVLNWERNYEEPKEELVKKDVEKPAPVIKEEEPTQDIQKATPKKKSPVKNPAKATPAAPAVTPVIEQPVEQLAVVSEPINNTQYPITNTQYPMPNTQQAITNNQYPISNTQQKGITLTYSLPPVKKTEPITEPTVAETKKTGLERVLEIAKEVKNGDNALGELREAKNDILAFEFRKDKDKKKSN